VAGILDFIASFFRGWASAHIYERPRVEFNFERPISWENHGSFAGSHGGMHAVLILQQDTVNGLKRRCRIGRVTLKEG
jgi:hypothetical protein